MPNLAQQLKAEIGRIAKKEIRAETQSYKKAAMAHRAEMLALKRRIQTLETALKRVGQAEPQAAPHPRQEDTEKLRFRVDGFAKLRQKLGLSAADMARILGVSGQSVYHWETGKTRPRASQLKAIAAVRKLGKKEIAARLAAMTETKA
jgi:DNA-binding transcriptional regulator YiaG